MKSNKKNEMESKKKYDKESGGVREVMAECLLTFFKFDFFICRREKGQREGEEKLLKKLTKLLRNGHTVHAEVDICLA